MTRNKHQPMYSILYVDDEQDNLDVFEANFWKDYKLHLAISATEAKSILDRERVDLLIVDQRMPGITGVEFLKSINEQFPELLRMVLTGYSDSKDIIEAINNGKINHYVTKPWRKAQLKRIIDDALDIVRLREENGKLFNDLQKTNDTLLTLNTHLEERVAQRTQELHEKNVKLSEMLLDMRTMFSHMVESERSTIINTVLVTLDNEIREHLHGLSDDLNNIGNEPANSMNVRLQLDMAEQRVNRCIGILDSVKYFTGLGSEKSNLVNVQKGLEASVQLLTSQAKEWGIVIETDFLAKGKPCNCNMGAINYAFINILQNSIDAIQERFYLNSGGNGKINVRTQDSNGYLKIIIEDNGVGMSSNVLESLFQPFYTTKSGRNGLGLSIASDIIKRHQGTISIESDIGAGTSLVINLPYS